MRDFFSVHIVCFFFFAGILTTVAAVEKVAKSTKHKKVSCYDNEVLRKNFEIFVIMYATLAV
jgi:hypothetical protein